MTALLDPFRALALWLVSLLPPGAGDLATGSAVMAGILLALFLLLLPALALGAYLEGHYQKRYGDRRP